MSLFYDMNKIIGFPLVVGSSEDIKMADNNINESLYFRTIQQLLKSSH